MKIGTSLRFLFPAGPQSLDIYKAMAAAAGPGAFIERPMGAQQSTVQAANLLEVARAARQAGMWALLTGDNHGSSAAFANIFQPVPTIARLSAETGSMTVGMVLLAPFYHPMLLAEQIGTLSAFVDAPLVVTFASGGNQRAFDSYGYTTASRGVRTEEVVSTVRALLAGESVTATGRSFQLRGSTISPLPLHSVDLWIAGTNEITVERAGRLGDGWLTAQNATDETLVEQLALYRSAAAEHHRPYLPVLRRDIHVAPTDEQARAHVDAILADGYRGVGYDRLIVGSPDTVLERLRFCRTLGFEHVLVRHVTGDHDAMIASFGLLADVVAELRD